MSLAEFAELAERVPAVAASEDFHISRRNPLYFSHADIGDADEEYFDSVCPEKLFESFDSFFAWDGAWEKFRGGYHAVFRLPAAEHVAEHTVIRIPDLLFFAVFA